MVGGSDHIGIVDTKCNPGKICEEVTTIGEMFDEIVKVEGKL